MMHKENVRKAQSDYPTETRLAELYNVFTGLTGSQEELAAKQQRIKDVAASKARKAQVNEQHSRSEAATEEGLRAPDRAYFVRPYGHLDKDLWAHGDIRSWYSGGASTGSLAGPDFGGPTLGATLKRSGYTVKAEPPVEAPNPYARDAPPLPRPEDGINSARFSSTYRWRAQANALHWMDREAGLQLEKTTARDNLKATAWLPDVVELGKPFKSRTAEEDAWRFAPPPPKALQETMVTARFQAAKPGVDNFRNSRVSSLRALATERSNFF